MPRSRSALHRSFVLFAVAAHAVRTKVDDDRLEVDTPEDLKMILSAPSRLICGSSVIRKFVTQPKEADEVRNIPWVDVFAVAEEYIRTQQAEMARLRTEIARLEEEIPRLEQAEAPKPVGREQLEAALKAALSAPGSYGSAEVAQASKCGAVSASPRVARGAFQAAKKAFEPLADQLFAAGNLFVEGNAFQALCVRLVRAGTTTSLDSNCPELCQQLTEMAVAASDKYAGGRAVSGRSSDQARRELKQQQDLLKLASAELEGCAQTKADLAVFRAQLQGLQGEIKTTHEVLRDARDTLMDAQYDLSDAEAQVQAQQAEFDKAQQVLSGAGALAQAALTKFQAAAAALGPLQTAMTASAVELDAARASLGIIQDAADALKKLKKAVSDSMLAMVMYFNDAVRTPVRKMGLSEEVNVDRLFPAEISSLESAKASHKSIEALGAFCTQPEWLTAVAAAAGSPNDPSPLCNIGSVPEIQHGNDEAIQETVASLKHSLRDVQSWLDPFRGQTGVSAATVEASAAEDVPEGLHQVISTFSRTTYYRQYLQHWGLKGKFLEVYHAVLQSLKKAEDAHGQATSKLAAVTAQLRASETAQAEAQRALEAATAANEVAQGQHAAAQQLLASMAANAEAAKRTLADLERAVEEAQRKWQAAKAALQDTHRQATSFIALLQSLEEGA